MKYKHVSVSFFLQFYKASPIDMAIILQYMSLVKITMVII